MDNSTPTTDAATDTTTVRLDGELRDRAFIELKTTRNLQVAVSSIERFLLNQIDRIESAFKECQRIEEAGRVVQQKWIELEEEKQAWQKHCEQEISEINEAKRKLAQGLRKLESKQIID
jgi:ABC-type transporter Mla MlaB component